MLSMVNMHLRFLSNHLLLLAFLIFFIQYGYEILNRNSFSVFIFLSPNLVLYSQIAGSLHQSIVLFLQHFF